MAAEGMRSLSVMSVVEDVLKQHGTRLSDLDFASRKADESSMRRYEAARWLRKIVGVVCSKDLPAEPSEVDFRQGLRSGIILCTAINKVQPGSIPKVVEAPNDIVSIPDGAALMAFQYFENIRNFLVAVEELGLPTFEASDLEQGGKTARIVNCVLALKSFSDWKIAGGSGTFKYSDITRASSAVKNFSRKTSEPFTNSLSRTSSVGEKSLDGNEQYSDAGLEFNDVSNNRSLNMMIRALLTGKKQEEIPNIVETMLSKVMEEFERQLGNQPESQVKSTPEIMSVSGQIISPPGSPKAETQNDDEGTTGEVCETEQATEEDKAKQFSPCKASESHLKKHNVLFDRQKSDIQELKNTVHATKESLKLLQMKHHQELSVLGQHLHSLAHAASGYKKVLEENRKLYNTVQDLKGNIRVYCRVRPFLPGQENGFTSVDHIEDGNISIMNPVKYSKDGKKTFNFNKVFGPAARQAEVYADMQPLVRSCLDGYNVCIFAYGQTGSGKTFTMTGPDNLTEETYGVNYRALNDLFYLAEQRKATFSYEVSVQMMEIYNEQVRDLLDSDNSNKKLEIRNSSQNGINVPDANRLPVSTTSDVISLMTLGHKNRAVSSTAMNDRSSRSHSCMTVHVQGKDLTSGAVLRGCVHLVDLAGSERVDKSEVTGDRLKEAQHINKSLAALGDVIASLASKNGHVPYRNSKLTQLLQDSLGGQAKTLMFVHISPEADAIGETISTLKFAERVSTVELGAARANKETGNVKELKEQIYNLKAALARKEEEVEQLSRSVSSTPETQSVRSTASSPVHPTYQTTKDGPNGRKSPAGRRSPVKDPKGKKSSPQRPRRKSLDPNDLLANAAHWPPLSVVKAEEKILTSGDWIGKVMRKQNSLDSDHSLENFVDESRKSSDNLYQRHTLDDNKVKQPFSSLVANRKDNQLDSDAKISTFDLVTPPDSIDELDINTSDSSDQEFQVQIPRVASLPSLSSKIKPPQVKSNRSPEKKSFIPMPPMRRLSNGASPAVIKSGRQSAYVKRKTGNVK